MGSSISKVSFVALGFFFFAARAEAAPPTYDLIGNYTVSGHNCKGDAVSGTVVVTSWDLSSGAFTFTAIGIKTKYLAGTESGTSVAMYDPTGQSSEIVNGTVTLDSASLVVTVPGYCKDGGSALLIFTNTSPLNATNMLVLQQQIKNQNLINQVQNAISKTIQDILQSTAKNIQGYINVVLPGTATVTVSADDSITPDIAMRSNASTEIVLAKYSHDYKSRGRFSLTIPLTSAGKTLFNKLAVAVKNYRKTNPHGKNPPKFNFTVTLNYVPAK